MQSLEPLKHPSILHSFSSFTYIFTDRLLLKGRQQSNYLNSNFNKFLQKGSEEDVSGRKYPVFQLKIKNVILVSHTYTYIIILLKQIF